MQVTEAGIHNVLRHWGALRGEPSPAPSTVLDIPESGAYVISEEEGLLEWLVGLGDPVAVGQPIARIYDTVKLGAAPIDVHATIDGVIAMRHFPGLVKLGDAIAMQARIA